MERGVLSGRRILLVEDEFFVGEMILAMLEDENADIVGTARTVEEALALVERHQGRLDQVILDLNLHGSMTYPVADQLLRTRVPFIFVTGYSASAIDERYRKHPRCLKPITAELLIKTLQANRTVHDLQAEPARLRAGSSQDQGNAK